MMRTIEEHLTESDRRVYQEVLKQIEAKQKVILDEDSSVHAKLDVLQ